MFYPKLNSIFCTLLLGGLSLWALDTSWNAIRKACAVTALFLLGLFTGCDSALGIIPLILLFRATRSLPYKWLILVSGLLILIWLSLKLTISSPFLSIVPAGVIPLLGKPVEGTYLSVLSLIPCALCTGQPSEKSLRYFTYSSIALIACYWLHMLYLLLFVMNP